MTDHAEIVTALRGVPGVARADIDRDSAGGLGVLRLRLAVGADEVAVAAAVGRLLRERFGLGVDTDRVQLVEDVGPPTGHRRPALQQVSVVSAGLTVTAAVTLRVGEATVEGSAEAAASAVGERRAVATATLRAVQRLLAGRARFELEHVEAPAGTPLPTLLVSVAMTTAAGTEQLTGSAAVRNDPGQACARATLAAVNRRLGRLLG